MNTLSLVSPQDANVATRLGISFAIAYAGIGVLWILISDGLAEVKGHPPCVPSDSFFATFA